MATTITGLNPVLRQAYYDLRVEADAITEVEDKPYRREVVVPATADETAMMNARRVRVIVDGCTAFIGHRAVYIRGVLSLIEV